MVRVVCVCGGVCMYVCLDLSGFSALQAKMKFYSLDGVTSFSRWRQI